MTIGLAHYLAVAAILFTIGVFGIFVNRKNIIVILMSVELILLAVNINLVAFSRFGSHGGQGNLDGQLFAVFVIVIAAAEVAVALAIVLTLYRLRRTTNLDEADILKG